MIVWSIPLNFQLSLKKISDPTFLQCSVIILLLDHWQIQCCHLVKRAHCHNHVNMMKIAWFYHLADQNIMFLIQHSNKNYESYMQNFTLCHLQMTLIFLVLAGNTHPLHFKERFLAVTTVALVPLPLLPLCGEMTYLAFHCHLLLKI